MNEKLKDLRVGVRLNIKKPPKIEIPKNVYNRKVKHKKGLEDEKSRPFLLFSNLVKTIVSLDTGDADAADNQDLRSFFYIFFICVNLYKSAPSASPVFLTELITFHFL